MERPVTPEDGWGGLGGIGAGDEMDVQEGEPSAPRNPYEGDPDEIIDEEDLPFTRFKPVPEEETPESIRTSPSSPSHVPYLTHAHHPLPSRSMGSRRSRTQTPRTSHQVCCFFFLYFVSPDFMSATDG